MTKILLHPFKMGVYDLLRSQFPEKIVDNFRLEFEVDVFRKDTNQNILKQKKDNNLILEVYYKQGGYQEFICDLYSWETKRMTEWRLFGAIRDAFQSGKLKLVKEVTPNAKKN